jgi:vacuolar-type H+-ATPase subunit I/STV1
MTEFGDPYKTKKKIEQERERFEKVRKKVNKEHEKNIQDIKEETGIGQLERKCGKKKKLVKKLKKERKEFRRQFSNIIFLIVDEDYITIDGKITIKEGTVYKYSSNKKASLSRIFKCLDKILENISDNMKKEKFNQAKKLLETIDYDLNPDYERAVHKIDDSVVTYQYIYTTTDGRKNLDLIHIYTTQNTDTDVEGLANQLKQKDRSELYEYYKKGISVDEVNISKIQQTLKEGKTIDKALDNSITTLEKRIDREKDIYSEILSMFKCIYMSNKLS